MDSTRNNFFLGDIMPEEKEPQIYVNFTPPEEEEPEEEVEEAPKPRTKLEIWKERQRKQAEG